MKQSKFSHLDKLTFLPGIKRKGMKKSPTAPGSYLVDNAEHNNSKLNIDIILIKLFLTLTIRL